MMRVLLVEDELLLRRVGSAMLEKLGCEVTAAPGGKAALEHAGLAWDFVLMDCQMPVLNGLDAAREWRRRGAKAGAIRTLIVGLTNSDSPEERALCLQAGMDDCVAKPLSPDKIERLLEWVQEQADISQTEASPMRALRDGYLGHESLLLELARGFQNQLPLRWEQLEQLVEAGDTASAASAARALKTKAISLHALELVVQLETFEAGAQSGDLEACQRALPSLRAALQSAQRQMTGLVALLGTNPAQ